LIALGNYFSTKLAERIYPPTEPKFQELKATMETSHNAHAESTTQHVDGVTPGAGDLPCSHLLFESIPTPALIWTFADQRFWLTKLNAAAKQWGQGVMDQRVGSAADELYHDRPDLLDLFHRCMAQMSAIRHEATLPLGGSPDDRFVKMTFTYVSPEMLLLHINDVTPYRLAEVAFRNEHAKLRALLENTDSAIWSVDREHRLIVGNKVIERSVNKAIGSESTPASDKTPDHQSVENNDEWRGYYDRALRGERFSVEQVLYAPDQPQWVEFHFAPIQDEEGMITGATVLGQNISARKQAEETLRESEERFRLAFEMAYDGVCLVGLDGRLLRVNAAMSEIFGYSKAELEQMTVTDITHPDYLDVSPKFIRQAIAQPGSNDAFEKAYIHRNGSTVWGRVSSSLVRDSQGQPLYFISHVQDITERKRSERERQQLQTQLIQVQKMETVGRLAGGIAHDFNNQLAVILIRTEMSLALIDPNSTLYRNLTTIYSTAQRTADLVHQLLAFARKQVVKPQKLDLNQVIEPLLPILQPLIKKDVELIWQPAPALWLVEIDPSQLHQVLVNLCTNASDAIEGIGAITITADNVVLQDTVAANGLPVKAGEYVMISISDNGAGIPAEELPHIFEPFFTTKEVGQGSGLGLAVVDGIVQQNGGQIHVVSKPGEGATFTIFLPRFVVDAPKQTQTQPQSALQRENETILIVEDEELVLQLMTEILSHLGYKVLAASTPSDAVRILNEHDGPIDLLVTDIIMPEMNGPDLAQQIVDQRPEIKVLYLSGYPAETIVQYRVDEDEMHFLQKPFSLTTLAAKVRLVLEHDNKA
jgi:PAS domain S-box-containing protein